MIDALSMDYIRTARAKGLREKVVIYSHAWRNALLPVVTVIIGWFISIFREAGSGYPTVSLVWLPIPFFTGMGGISGVSFNSS